MSKTSMKWTESLERDGFVLLEQFISDSDLQELTNAVEAALEEKPGTAGVRFLLKRSAKVKAFAKSELLTQAAEAALGSPAKPVKAILFDKSPDANWYVTWHQD